jgi:hypothetical protein
MRTRVEVLTSDKITHEPLYIVPPYPMCKREKTVAVLRKLSSGRDNLTNPFGGGRLLLNVRIGGADCEYTLSSSYSFRAGFVAVVKVDTKNFGNAIANLVRHDGDVCPGGRGN